MKTTIIIAVFCAASFAQDGVREKLNPPAKMKLDLPKTAPATQPAATQPAIMESFVPKLPVRPDRRAARKLPAVADPQPAAELPPLPPNATDPPSRVTFDPPSPYRVTGSPSTSLRLPNLVGPPRRAMWQSTNPSVNPSPAVSTPTVNNTDGTTALALMPPFTRRLIVDPAPIPAPLPIGEEPYVQAPGAPDDADAPVGSGALPAVRLE